MAASSVAPLPCEVARARELGRTAITTGRPIRSSPVILASRVMPISGMKRRFASSVSDGLRVRSVPSRKPLGVRVPWTEIGVTARSRSMR
ncbi:hypothetical protein LP419_15550 [Massilia sp. H-1]|nr:hypothetical protein LP419_15550 [Massilia sp. H-1]